MVEEGEAELQLQRAFGGHAAEVDRRRQEFYQLLDEFGEAEVDRRVHSGEWLNDPNAPLKPNWAAAWLREQKIRREDRAVMAAEATADAVTSSAHSARVSARWAIWASLIALLAIAWNVWGS